MAGTQRQRSDAELAAISEHLWYEIQMFLGAAEVLTRGDFTQGGGREAQVLKNALVESFLIHTRNLLAFLYPHNPRPNDVIAEDFLPDPAPWVSRRPPKAQKLQDTQGAISKRLAHITYAKLQVTPETKSWPSREIVNEIMAVLRVYLPLVPADRVSSDFAGFMAELLGSRRS